MLKSGNGLHLMLDMSGCSRKLLEDKEGLEKLINGLPTLVGMTLIKPAEALDYKMGTDDIDSGYTLVCILSESHCSLHTFNKRSFLHLDLFSCQSFDVKKVEKELRNVFKPSKVERWVVKRGKLMDDYKKVSLWNCIKDLFDNIYTC